MNTKPLAVLILVLAFCIPTFGQTPDMDKELSVLAAKVAEAINGNTNKKVTVMDFTDLQGGSSELGKYIAEQLTIDLVTGKRGFAVMDRANRQTILAELNLPKTGLVDPKTAQSFGKFAGVDALILGTITLKGTKVSVTAKIITTETSEIVGAAKTEFEADDNARQLFEHAAPAIDSAGPSANPVIRGRDFSAPNTTQKFTGFTVELLSFRILPNGKAVAALEIANTTRDLPIAIAANKVHYDDGQNPWFKFSSKAVDDHGNILRCTAIDGLYAFEGRSVNLTKSGFEDLQKVVHLNPPHYGWITYMKEIKPNESSRFTMDFIAQNVPNRNQSGTTIGKVFKLQGELITAEKRPGSQSFNPKLEDIYFENIVPKSVEIPDHSK